MKLADKINNAYKKCKCTNVKERVERKFTTSGKVVFGLEPSLVKYYRDYWLISGRDALNCSAVYVNQNNKFHTKYFQTPLGSHGCVHFGPEQHLIFMSALENSAQNSHRNGPNPHSHR